MGQTILVDELERSGARLLEALDVDGRLSIEAAFWLLDPLTEAWRLYYAVTEVTSLGPLAAYRVVQETVRRLNLPGLELADIAVVSPAEPIVVVLRSALQTGPGVYGIRFSRNSIGGVYVEDAYIYRLTTSEALQADPDELSVVDPFLAEVQAARGFFEECEIHRPLWEIVVQPMEYISGRLPGPNQMRVVVVRAAVQRRGWDFPHIGRGPKTESRWIESRTDAAHHLEAFRFYPSGLFAWRREFQEQRESGMQDKVLFRGTIYSFAEYLEFAARLADQLKTDVHVSILAQGLSGRSLWDDRSTLPPLQYLATQDEFAWEGIVTRKDLATEWRRLSVVAANEFIELFEFDTNYGQVVKQWQDRFLDGGAA